MSLRAFILAISGSVLALGFGLFYAQSHRALDRAFTQLEDTHLATVRQNAQSLIETAKYSAESYQRFYENNNAFSSRFLVDMEHHRSQALHAELDKLKKTFQCDLLEIIPRGGLFTPLVTQVSPAFELALRGTANFAVVEAAKETWLLSLSPLRNFGEPIGVVVIGYALNQRFSPLIQSATQAKVTFQAAKPGQLQFSGVALDIQSPFLTALNRRTLEDMSWVGAASLAILIVLLYSLLEFGFVRRFRRLLGTVDDAARKLDSGIIETPQFESAPISEVNRLSQSFGAFSKSLTQFSDRVRESSRQEAFIEVVEQVSHDIKSPLSALDLMLATEGSQNRPRLRACIQRIQETLQQISPKHRAKAAQATWIWEMVDALGVEKAIQFQSRSELTFSVTLEPTAFASFSHLDANEFKRILSNLIDNSAQAIEGSGSIHLHLSHEDTTLLITLKDTGRGIPADVLPQLGIRGASFGKPDGQGLGLYHARTTLESWGGNLTIDSTEGQGTLIELRLPRVPTPAWFLPGLPRFSEVVLVDDDPSQAYAWRLKLQKSADPISLRTFSRGEDFHAWFVNAAPVPRLYIFDFEIPGSARNGIEWIEHSGLAREAVLATGHFGDPKVQSECGKRGIRMLSKFGIRWLPFLASLLFGFLPSADAKPTLAQWLLNQEVTFSTDPAPWAKQPRAVMIWSQVYGLNSQVEAGFLSAVAKEKLRRLGIVARLASPDTLQRLQRLADSGVASPDPSEILGPKIFVEMESEKQSAACRIFRIRYLPTENPRHYRPDVRSETREWSGLLPSELEGKAAGFVRETIEKWESDLRPSGVTPKPRQTYVGSCKGTLQAQSDRPATSSRLFEIGVSLGSPAWVNAHFGIWGLEQTPLFISASGMYLSQTARGAQISLGGIFDREGSVQQGLGLGVAFLNERRVELESIRDALGNEIRVDEVGVDRLKVFLGPVYAARWKSLRLQLGVAYRVEEGHETPWRALIQIGYVPVWDF